MPVITGTPIARVYNQWYILNFQVNMMNKCLSINYAKVCIEEGKVIVAPGTTATTSIVGDEFVSFATTMADGTKSLYENIKSKLYGYLFSKNLIDGTLS